MLRLTELRLPLDHSEDALRQAALRRLGIGAADLLASRSRAAATTRASRRRSGSSTRSTWRCGTKPPCSAAAPATRGSAPAPDTRYRFVARAPEPGRPPRPVVVGAGPCGLMAALVLAQMGFRPLILERGQPVRQRTKDTWGLWRRGVLQPESNVQFGEGGAGTFSDGKLYSQIRDPRHLGRKVLEEFVRAGAPEEILWVSKPHIGTFRLVTVVEGMRAEIERLGGEYRFGARVADLADRARPRRRAGTCAAWCSTTARRSRRPTSCWRPATAPATSSPPCSAAAWRWRRSRSRSASASSTRSA